MADDKKLNFGIRPYIDSIDFDRGLTEIQKKIKAMQQETAKARQIAQTLGQDQQLGQFARSAYGQVSKQGLQELQQQEQQLRSKAIIEIRELEDKKKSMDKLVENQKKLEASGKDLSKTDKERLELLQKQNEALEKSIRLNTQNVASIRQARQQMGDPTLQDEQNMGPLSAERIGQLRSRAANVRAYRAMGFGRGTSRALSRLGGPAAVGSGLLMAVGVGSQITSNILDEVAEKDRRIGMAQGSAATAGSQELQNVMQRRGLENLYFEAERRKAFGEVSREFENRRMRDVIRGVTPNNLVGAGITAGTTWAGAKAGAAIGGGIGAWFGGVGAAPGAAIGGLIGGGIGYFGGRAATDRDYRQALFNTEEYRATLTAEQIQKSRALEQANRAKNFRKTYGYQYLTQNENMFNQYQQLFGEQDSMRLGGMLEQFNQQGMTGQTALQIARAQQSAAGMTMRPGTQDVRTAYELRQAGMTNIDKAMGLMRGVGATFGEKSTDESLKKFFAEAFSSGITDSGMVEEIRVFTDASLNLAQKTGMRVEEAAGQVSKGMVGEFSAMGLQGQLGARQVQKELSTAGGASLDYKLAFANSSEGRQMLGGMTDTADILQFANLDIDNISENNPAVKSLMKKMGINDIEEFRRRKSEFDIAGGTRTGQTRQRFLDFSKKLAGMSGKERQEFLSGEGATEYQEILANLEAENPTFKQDFKSQIQLFGRYGEELGLTETRTREKKELEDLKKRPTGAMRPEDIKRRRELAVKYGDSEIQELGDLEKMPEFLASDESRKRKEELQQKYGTSGMLEELKGRGRGQLTTGIEDTRAKDERLMMQFANGPGKEGKSPYEMLGDSVSKYDAATDKFAEAVERMEEILAGASTKETQKEIADLIVNLTTEGQGKTTKQQSYTPLDFNVNLDNYVEMPSTKPKTGN